MQWNFTEFVIDAFPCMCYDNQEVIGLKQYIRLTILILAVLLCITGIFSQSVRTREESNSSSLSLTELLKPILDPLDRLSVDDFNHFIRKTAHLTEFAILGILVGLLFHQIGRQFGGRYISCPLLITLSTAVTDEWIQTLNDRGSQVIDVMLDFGGGILGFVLIFIILTLFTEGKTYGNQLR